MSKRSRKYARIRQLEGEVKRLGEILREVSSERCDLMSQVSDLEEELSRIRDELDKSYDKYDTLRSLYQRAMEKNKHIKLPKKVHKWMTKVLEESNASI